MPPFEGECVFTFYQWHTVIATVPPPFLGEGGRGRGNVLRILRGVRNVSELLNHSVCICFLRGNVTIRKPR